MKPSNLVVASVNFLTMFPANLRFRNAVGTDAVSFKMGAILLALRGPEFIEFVEPPPIPSHELASVGSEIGSIAWLKSGLNSSCTSIYFTPPGQVDSCGVHI